MSPEYVVLGPVIVAAVTQLAKWLVQLTGADVPAIAAQIAAWVIATAGTFLVNHGLGGYVVLLTPLQTILAAALITPLSYVAHDLAAFIQDLRVWLNSLQPAPPPIVTPTPNPQNQ